MPWRLPKLRSSGSSAGDENARADMNVWSPKVLRADFLRVTDSGLTLAYTGKGQSDEDAAAAIAQMSCPGDRPFHYFEVTVLSSGEAGYIGIGLAAAAVLLDRLPGWESNSYGYHGDDGNAFHGHGKGTKYGPTFGTGDTVGCLLDRVNKTIRYTRNGELLAVAFRKVPCSSSVRLYPTVGLRSKGEKVKANFGKEPFVFDMDAYEQSCRKQLLDSILGTPLPSGSASGTQTWSPSPLPLQSSSSQVDVTDQSSGRPSQQSVYSATSDRGVSSELRLGSSQEPDRNSGNDVDRKNDAPCSLGNLVFGYLISQGHVETAKAVARELYGDSFKLDEALCSAMAKRKALYQAMAEGKIDEAIQVAESMSPGLMERNDSLHFHLKCQKLVEMIRAGDDEGPLAYAQEQMREAKNRSKEEKAMLEEAFALMAFADHENCPLSYMLEQSRRTQLADEINDALQWSGNSDRAGPPQLSRIYSQCAAALSALQESGDVRACLVDIDTDVLGITGTRVAAKSAASQSMLVD